MKKLLIFLVAFLVFAYASAQEKPSEPLHYTGTGASDIIEVPSKGGNYQLQFGNWYSFGYQKNSLGAYSLGFPYNIFYVGQTFLPEDFSASKGYYSDKVLLQWQIKGNQNQIERIKIYRTTLEKFNALQENNPNKRGLDFANGTDMKLIATLSKEDFQFEDERVQGGVLYKYMVVADGIPLNNLYINYIAGIGFRSPTANVSGAISYRGGSPVKDVKVTAEPVGASAKALGSSMKFSNTSDYLLVESNTDMPIKTLTLQNWMRFGHNTQQTPFEFISSEDNTYKITTNIEPDKKKISVSLYRGNEQIFNTTLTNSYPTGYVDAKGNDAFELIETIKPSDFIHYSIAINERDQVVLYINGRPITKRYFNDKLIDKITINEKPVIATTGNSALIQPSEKIKTLFIGKEFTGNIDEVRLWSRALKDQEIRRDFKRYINGSESGLQMYLRMDESTGNFAYDIARTDFNFHKNNAAKWPISTTNVAFSNSTPTKNQLGVFGITGKDGSYTISAIPYKGTGEQFVITPSLGVHKFNPASQTLFLGEKSSVVNQVDFEDTSSFKFLGRVVYDARGVFKDEASRDSKLKDAILDAVNKKGKSIKEVGYNQYLINGGTTVFKGKYFYEPYVNDKGELTKVTVDTNTGNLIGGKLRKYSVGDTGATASLGVEEANIYIDGNLVFDEDNQPIVTDKYGYFNIQVPIGKHKIEVKKKGHTFLLNGRFPEKTANKETNLFEFYEDQIEPRWFIDNTRVTVVGRVVGGRIESKKEIGFGFNGVKIHENPAEDGKTPVKETYSSVNNIGKATITFKGDINSNELDKVIVTNAETGEYRVELIPFKYFIKDGTGINIASNQDINDKFLDSNEELNFTEVTEKQTSVFKAKDGTSYKSEPYHYVKSYRYNSPVTLKMLEQQYLKKYKATDASGKETEYDVSELAVPLYKQKHNYKIAFETTQDYVNNDGTKPVVTKEYYNEGKFNINNALAGTNQGDTSIKIIRKKDREIYQYAFNAGLPNITQAEGFKKKIDVEYVIPGKNPITVSNSNEFKNEGIVVGGRSSAGTTFATVAPDTPDIILRDPPGSESFASIEKGTVISFESSNSSSKSDFSSKGLYISVGPTFTTEIGTPFFSVETEVNAVVDAEKNFKKTTEQNIDGSTNVSYEFTQTISTSDDPNFVGADGDLYIGNSKNIYYGFFDNIFVTSDVPKVKDGTTVPNIEVKAKDKDGKETTIYISARKDYFIAEQPSSTFFMYSQKYILETLIPSLESLANGVKPDPKKKYQSANFYKEQVKLWKKVIQENERDKYLALKDRDKLKGQVSTQINNLKKVIKQSEEELNKLKEGNFEIVSQAIKDKKEYLKKLKALLTQNFASNKSFDTGVGEFTSSVSTATVVSKSYEKTLDLSKDFTGQLGILLNDVGAVAKIESEKSLINSNSDAFEKELTNTISYTLKDSDLYNALSVDVINSFDGNGPIFITKGGATSCPYEGEAVSEFYKHNGYNKDVIGEGGETLSEATISVFKPQIKSDKVKKVNIPESDDAVFTLKLKNLSTTKTDLEHLLFVDNSTLGGAQTNISQSGISIFLPYNETVEYPLIISKKSSLSKYKFDGIKVYIGNPCEGTEDILESDAADSIELSVEFKKSCSKVTVSAPQENWIFNRQEAFSSDADGNITNNSLPIKFTDFNTDFASFKKIELQYRNANASSWIKFQTYYGTEKLKQDASDDNAIVIGSEAEFTYNWKIVDNNIPDGDYEIRAVAYCTDNVVYESKVVKGTINLTSPVVFGTPEPSDGILDIGEDIKVRFNEPVTQGISSDINIRGLKKQQPIDHSVSATLDGSANTIELPKQGLTSESFTIQFWYQNEKGTNGTLLQQQNGPKITLQEDNVTFTLDNETITTLIDGSQYNFYSFIYKGGEKPFLEILQNGKVLKTKKLNQALTVNSTNDIIIGGTGVKGSIHDIRIWNKAKTSGQAAAEKDLTLTGGEKELQAYWQLTEGHGNVGAEKVHNRHAKVNVSWAIKPKGEAYEFSNNSFLTLDNVAFVQPTSYEDITMSFWVKANNGDKGTIFSNGTGNDNPAEPKQTNGFRNKWNLSVQENGKVNLRTEGKNYELTNEAITDGKWHHIALVLRRRGTINSYLDGKQHSSISSENIGGIAGAKMLLGARINRSVTVNAQGIPTGSPIEKIDDYFTGKLDEFRLWNTARDFEQIKRDRYFEIDRETAGLLLYSKFAKKDANVATRGPLYNIRKGDGTIKEFLAVLNDGTGAQKFVTDGPAIKPALPYINIPFTTVINKDEMIIVPNLTTQDWSLFEGQILDISVASMYDAHNNKQLSPISFTAYVNKQEIEWFTKDKKKELSVEKKVNEAYEFIVDVVNKGGKNQPYTITGLPSWMQVSKAKGNLSPNTSEELTFTIDKELTMGSYEANLYMNASNNTTDKIDVKLRVISDAPDWSVNNQDYAFSMNVVGNITIDNELVRDQYTKVGAFVNNEPRGEARLQYDKISDSYFVYLNIYSNDETSSEKVRFKVWDALKGRILSASINSEKEISFIQNNVVGTKSNPAKFTTGDLYEQIIHLNKGWSWITPYVQDEKMKDLNSLFNNSSEEGDYIKSRTLEESTGYYDNKWKGSLSELKPGIAYKVRMESKEKTITLQGELIDLKKTVAVTKGWNMLAYPQYRNISVKDALAFYTPTDGDVIKSQLGFAIYDKNANNWSGTLQYLKGGKGYMLKTGKTQSFVYGNSVAGRGTRKHVADNSDNRISVKEKQWLVFPENMNLVVEVLGNLQEAEEIQVFDKQNNVRGITQITTDTQGRKLAYLTVYGNEKQEELSIRLRKQNKLLSYESSFNFVPNNVKGTFSKPYQLDFETSIVANTLIVVYPTPFSSMLYIKTNSATAKKLTIEVFTTAGSSVLKKVLEVKEGVAEVNLESLQLGSYMLHITNELGTTTNHKIIKK